MCARVCVFCRYLSVTDGAACHLCFRARGWSPAWCDAVTPPAAWDPSTYPSTSATSCCWTSAVTSGSTTPWVSVCPGPAGRPTRPGKVFESSPSAEIQNVAFVHGSDAAQEPMPQNSSCHKVFFFFSFKGLKKKKKVRITLAQMTYILINVITALSIFQAGQREKRCKCESEKLCSAHTGMF